MIECRRDRNELMARARTEIERAARGEVAQLYTEEILFDATELLADVYAVGLHRDIEPDRWDLDPRPTVDVAGEFGLDLSPVAELANQINHGHPGNPFQPVPALT